MSIGNSPAGGTRRTSPAIARPRANRGLRNQRVQRGEVSSRKSAGRTAGRTGRIIALQLGLFRVSLLRARTPRTHKTVSNVTTALYFPIDGLQMLRYTGRSGDNLA